MTDDLTPQQTDAVRRALRAARHEAPLPADVAARLDATLAGLVADRTRGAAAAAALSSDATPGEPAGEPAADTTRARVIPLRRRWPALLAAAAAVTAIGLAGSQLVDRGDDSGAHPSADKAGNGASTLTERREDASDNALDSDGEVLSQLDASAEVAPLTVAQRAALAAEGYRRIQLAPEVRAALSESYRSAAKALPSDSAESAPDADLRGRTGCALPDLDLPDGVAPVTYLARRDGERVVLLVLPGPEVTAYPCDGGEPTRLALD